MSVKSNERKRNIKKYSQPVNQNENSTTTSGSWKIWKFFLGFIAVFMYVGYLYISMPPRIHLSEILRRNIHVGELLLHHESEVSQSL